MEPWPLQKFQSRVETMDCQYLPPLLPPACVQLKGALLNNSEEQVPEDEGNPWLAQVAGLLKRPETASLFVDSEFIRLVDEGQWIVLLDELERAAPKSSLVEFHIDLRLMSPSYVDGLAHRVHLLLEKASGSKTGAMEWGIRKVAIFGMTSRCESFLSIVPSSVIELMLFFAPEPHDSGEGPNNRRTRIQALLQQYLSPHPSLTSITIKYDENADDLLPISAFSLAAMISCSGGVVKIELERCNVFCAPENENDDRMEEEDNESRLPADAVFQALRDNSTLFLLRFRSGSLDTTLGESIARAVEVGNTSLRYLDFGDNEGVGSTVAGAVTKAIMRNPFMQGFELNLNSIEEFSFASLGNLTCMDLSDNLMRDEGALQIAQLLPACRLERMNLADNGIGQIGGCAIAWGLMHNNSLSKINICNNPLVDPHAGEGPTSDVTTRVFNSFKHTPAYRQGFLGMLCASTKQNKTLSFLNLANIGLEDAHGPLLSILLRVSNLDGLGLLRNNIGDQACMYMCQALSKYRTSMRVLMLETNPISARGFCAMWKGVLLVNDNLVSVSWGKRTYKIKGVERGQRDLDIVLRLNRAGMIRLRRDKNATHEQWIEALIELRNDLDCSFSFLSENPLIFNSFQKVA